MQDKLSAFPWKGESNVLFEWQRKGACRRRGSGSLEVSLAAAAGATKKRGLPESLQQRSPSRRVSRDPREDASPSHVGSEAFWVDSFPNITDIKL